MADAAGESLLSLYKKMVSSLQCLAARGGQTAWEGKKKKKNEKEKKTEDDTPCRGGLVCAGKVVRNMDARWEAEPRNVAPEPADHKSGGFGPKEGFGNIIMPS